VNVREPREQLPREVKRARRRDSTVVVVQRLPQRDATEQIHDDVRIAFDPKSIIEAQFGWQTR
jgi:hypothetical protein